MRIEQRAKTVDQDNSTAPRTGTCGRAAPAQALRHDAQENPQRQRLDHGIVLQVVAQPLGNRRHPLASRQPRKNVVGQMGAEGATGLPSS